LSLNVTFLHNLNLIRESFVKAVEIALQHGIAIGDISNVQLRRTPFPWVCELQGSV